MLLVSCSVLTLARSAPPPVTMLPQYNQALNVMVSQGTSSGGTVAYMGTFVGGDGTAKCRAACLSSRKRCWSFVHFPLAAPAPATNGSSPLNGEFKITLHSSGKQLQADDLADKLLSTRYQTDDDYSRYIFSPVGDGTGAVRIAVKADGLLLQANDSPGAGAPVCPAHAVSALAGKKDDALHHFVLERNEGAEGTYAIKVVGSGRYWTVEDGADGFVSTSAAPSNTAGAFDITPFGGEFAGQCFSVSSPGFNPSYDASAVSGIVKWRCRNDDDCSLNGKCDASTGACACRPAWKGRRCELLNLGEPTRGAGYRGTDDGHNTSSWGGAVLKGGDGVYHMWAAEMTEHCGIGTWQQNSRVIHATSATPGGVYTRKVRRAFQNSPRQHTNSRLEVGASNASSTLLTRHLPPRARTPHSTLHCGRTSPGKCSRTSPRSFRVRTSCFMYRYILRESCSQFDSPPLTSLAFQVRTESTSCSSLRIRGASTATATAAAPALARATAPRVPAIARTARMEGLVRTVGRGRRRVGEIKKPRASVRA